MWPHSAVQLSTPLAAVVAVLSAEPKIVKDGGICKGRVALAANKALPVEPSVLSLGCSVGEVWRAGRVGVDVAAR